MPVQVPMNDPGSIRRHPNIASVDANFPFCKMPNGMIRVYTAGNLIVTTGPLNRIKCTHLPGFLHELLAWVRSQNNPPTHQETLEFMRKVDPLREVRSQDPDATVARARLNVTEESLARKVQQWICGKPSPGSPAIKGIHKYVEGTVPKNDRI